MQLVSILHRSEPHFIGITIAAAKQFRYLLSVIKINYYCILKQPEYEKLWTNKKLKQRPENKMLGPENEI